jgi:hypothetical protein
MAAIIIGLRIEDRLGVDAYLVHRNRESTFGYFEYLRYVLTHIAEHPINKIDDLPPGTSHLNYLASIRQRSSPRLPAL